MPVTELSPMLLINALMPDTWGYSTYRIMPNTWGYSTYRIMPDIWGYSTYRIMPNTWGLQLARTLLYHRNGLTLHRPNTSNSCTTLTLTLTQLP